MSSDGAEGLALIKPAVRAQSAYTLSAPAARRKLNQNESPWDVPPELKREVLERGGARAVAALSRIRAAGCSSRRWRVHYGWTAEGVLVGNGSNELIQATLAVTLEPGDVVVAPAPDVLAVPAAHDGARRTLLPGAARPRLRATTSTR